MIERAAPRIVPRLPITLAIQEPGHSSTFGLVADISGKGACVLTFGELAQGVTIECSLNFPKRPEPLGLVGRVVWVTREKKVPSRCGLQFEIEPGRELLLETLLEEVSPN